MSTLYVDNLQPNLGNAVHAAGHVVQVVHNSIQGVTSTASTTYVPSGLSVTISPKFSTSKLVVSIHGSRPYIDNGEQIDFMLYEGASAVTGNRLGSVYHNSGSAIYYGGINYLSYLDAASTTARTYNMYFRSATTGTVYLSDAGDIGMDMMVMEIAQ